MEEWVALRPILEVYDRETDSEGRGRRQELCMRQTEARKQVSDTLKKLGGGKGAALEIRKAWREWSRR